VKRPTAVAAVLVATMLLVPATRAVTIQATYQARYGPYGTITVRQFTDGAGSAVINMYALAPSRAYTFSLASGRCTTSIAPLIPAKTIKVTAAGKLGQTWKLSAAQMATIVPRLSSATLVAVLTSGSSRLCRTLYVPSAFTSSPSPAASPSPTTTPSPSAMPSPTANPTPTPGGTPPAGITANVSTYERGRGPTLTPASMADWFPALKVGVPASVTATVAPGQNVYALFVVPAGGSITFKITTNSGFGGAFWQWDPATNYWHTPAQDFYEGQYASLNGGTTWVFGLAYSTYAGPETLTITPTAIARP